MINHVRALYLTLLFVSACATRLISIPPPPDMVVASTDLAGERDSTDMADALPSFLGRFTWDSSTGSSTTVCDSGNTVGPPPMGSFSITSGPGPGQVNIGAGTTTCPAFVFDVEGETATVSNVGETCPSGPGIVSVHTGTLTVEKGGLTLAATLVLDLTIPNGTGAINHCVLTLSGNMLRDF